MFFSCPKKIGLSELDTAEVLVESGPAALPRLRRYSGREDVRASPPGGRASEVHVWQISLDCSVERDKGSPGLSRSPEADI